MKAETLGFSIAPGGLLLPYHLGALDALDYHRVLSENTPIAGSSAGSIAVAAKACSMDSKQVLENTIALSDACRAMGGVAGRILPLVREQLEAHIGPNEWEAFQSRPGISGVAYKELLPRYRPILQTEFEDKSDLINAVCHSSSFPFFGTLWPCSLDTSGKMPRLVVDGFFNVPRERFGCPEFELADVSVDRTVVICPYPQESICLTAVDPVDCICPTKQGSEQFGRLFRIATEPSSREKLTELYDAGFTDAEAWCHTHLAKESALALN